MTVAQLAEAAGLKVLDVLAYTDAEITELTVEHGIGVTMRKRIQSEVVAIRQAKAQSAQEPHDFNDDAYWIQAPPGDPDPGASTDADEPVLLPVWVDCRINLRKVSKVDTVNGTAFVRIEIVRLSQSACLASVRPDSSILRSGIVEPKLCLKAPEWSIRCCTGPTRGSRASNLARGSCRRSCGGRASRYRTSATAATSPSPSGPLSSPTLELGG